MADIFPAYLKSIASAFTASLCWLLTFVLTKFFGIFTEHFGAPAAYWMFAACSFLGLLFVLFQLPDTDGRSYNEIQSMIQGNRNSASSSTVSTKSWYPRMSSTCTGYQNQSVSTPIIFRQKSVILYFIVIYEGTLSVVMEVNYLWRVSYKIISN